PTDELIYTIIQGPSHGELSGSGRNMIYTPDLNFTGTDQFIFTVSDAQYTSEPAVITLQVSPWTPLDGWVGDWTHGDGVHHIIAAPGDPLKLSAVSAVSVEQVVAAVNGQLVHLSLSNAET